MSRRGVTRKVPNADSEKLSAQSIVLRIIRGAHMFKVRAAAQKIILFIMLLSSCAVAQDNIEVFIMDYPHGEDRLHVKRTGEAYLYYGALPSAQVIRKETFTANGLYEVFEKYLYPNLPRDEWPNPKSEAGMVTIQYMDGQEEDFLIFDVEQLAKEVFDKAKSNIVGRF